LSCTNTTILCDGCLVAYAIENVFWDAKKDEPELEP